VVRLLESPSLRADLGNVGRELVRARFSWDVIGETLAQVVKEAVNSRVTPAPAPGPRPVSAARGG